MEELIQALLDTEAGDRAEAIEIIKAMKEEIENGEDVQDVLLQYGLDLDYAIYLF
jgi:hypothetical protein